MRRLAGPVIQVRSLERRFGARRALGAMDLTVAAGEIHGLLGPTGSGKTTLLRVLAGLLPPSAGEAVVLGRPVGDPELRGRVGLVTVEDASAYQGISGLENLVFAARLGGMSPQTAAERARAGLLQVGLARAGHRPVGGWTPGMRVRLAFARALLTSPDVLLIDKLPPGIDSGSAAAVRSLVTSYSLSGAAIVCATRRLDELQGVAGSVTLLAGGRARYSGSVAALTLLSLAESAEDVADRIQRAA
jgi:ABC-2 type transport system ATP-binding protein